MPGIVAAMGAAGAVGLVFLIVVMAGEGLQQAGACASPLGALAGLVAAAAAVTVLIPRRPKVASPPESQVVLPPEPAVPEAERPKRIAPDRRGAESQWRRIVPAPRAGRCAVDMSSLFCGTGALARSAEEGAVAG